MEPGGPLSRWEPRLRGSQVSRVVARLLAGVAAAVGEVRNCPVEEEVDVRGEVTPRDGSRESAAASCDAFEAEPGARDLPITATRPPVASRAYRLDASDIAPGSCDRAWISSLR
jgi:hypothetical protein